MGRISPTDRSYRTHPEGDRVVHTSSGLWDHGALADLDRDRAHRPGDIASSQKVHKDRTRYLSSLLAPLDNQPDKLAGDLLDHFGSIAGITRASEAELRQVSANDGRWLDAFVVVRQLLNDGVKEELLRTHIGSNRDALVRHLYRSLRGLPEERLICVFADLEGFLIAEEILADGLEDLLPFSPRRIFRRALNLNARRLVLAHNHPSGCSRPSDSDIRDTRRLAEQAKGLGIVIEDHLVVGHTEVVSMKQRGLF